MIWLTWRQFRTQAIIAFAAMAAYAVLLAATGPHLATLFAADGLDGCRGANCANLADYFSGSVTGGPYSALWALSQGVILLAPPVIGLFWGAPLIARELETGTSALAWNQSVTRTRWLAVKLAAGALTAMAVAEAFSLMQSWWAAPISQAITDGASFAIAPSRFSELNFVTHGVTPLGYAAFALALGVTAGALFRRTLPAMAVTLALFIGLQVTVPLWVRPNLAPPDRMVIPVTSLSPGSASPYGPDDASFTAYADTVPGQPDAWLLSSGPVSTTGQATSVTPAGCTGTDPAAFVGCLGRHGIREAISYQPASRYWPFQLAETGLDLALALALAGYCFRVLRRHHRLAVARPWPGSLPRLDSPAACPDPDRPGHRCCHPGARAGHRTGAKKRPAPGNRALEAERRQRP